MEIKDLQARQGQVDLIAAVVSKAEVRTFNKFGKDGRVCNAKLKDDSGEVTLTLWNEQVDNVNVGDKIHIINGWVGEWQGEKQLSTGKFGQLEVVGKAEVKEETKEDVNVTKDEKELPAEDEDVIKDEEEIV
ncbi:MAG: hypothetical protein KKC75_02685 [Nanoarchaeota archaeon]|nr:hypothetical protein [Nanoarchaeota archaeon]MBU1004210.1 hypothetical protein [Nanoarchaeota archaeon]MBU1946167.1 hypothetical protein [Nanoarchaeota archaeon]